MMMVTTETEMSNMHKAMVAGANEYVMKPLLRGYSCQIRNDGFGIGD